MSQPFASSARATLLRSTRATVRPRTQQVARARAQARFNSSVNSQVSTTPAAAGASAVTGGLIGAGAVAAAAYGYYHYSGAKALVDSATAAKDTFSNAANKLKSAAPEPNVALDWLHEQATHYASFIPGGRKYVDAAFKDLDIVREKHGDEVNKIVQSAYADLQKVSKTDGFSVDAASKSWEILSSALVDVGKLAGESTEDIINNHPELKSSYDSLKSYGESYGPEAKKQVEDTIEQVKGVLAGGLSFETVSKLKKMVDEKKDVIKKLGDAAWDKGLKEAQPYLDKSPQIKELIEKNADALKSGKVNVAELFKKVASGNVDDLKSFVEQGVSKGADAAKSAGLDISKYADMFPGGGQAIEKVQQLQAIASKHGKEAEKLATDAWKEIEEVLKKKVSEAEKLAEKAKKDAK